MIGKGQRVAGRYLLETEIGAGGMGVVWRARDERLSRDVAVKLLAANAVGSDAARARLVREARAAGRLQHDGIVHVYDVGEIDDGGAFLVMELVAGHTLRTWHEQGKLTIDQRVELVLAVAEALACAHESGVVHRDVKPDNVIVRPSGRPILLDFGLAKPITTPLIETLGASGDSLQLTGTGNIVGTPAYLAPEQVSGANVGPASDQFSLAVMTFELLTGRLPWKGATVIEVLASMLHEPPLSARDMVPDLAEGVDEVLHRAMSKEPEQRFPSIAEFAEALRAHFPAVPAAHASTLPPLALEQQKPASRASPASGSAQRALEGRASAPRRNALTLALFGFGAGATLFGASALLERANRLGAAPAPSASALPAALAPNAVIACPLFKAEGELPKGANGFLGAAAGALACDRIQALLGGASARTLAPAELLPGIPREPSEQAKADPFDAADALERTFATAKQQADAYVEGALTKTPLDFAVALTLRTKDGRVLGAGSGRGEELFEAISSAVRETRAALGDGVASPFQKEWYGVDTTEAALDVLDVTTALLSETDRATLRACERAAKQTALMPQMAYLLRAVCHERLERTPLPDEPPAIDESSTGALVTTIAAQRTRGGAAETKKRVALLRSQQNAPKTTEGRAIVLSTIAELLYNVGDLGGAQAAARIAGQLAPKLVDPRGTPWHRLTFATEFGLGRAIRGVHASWLPWEPAAIANSGSPEDGFFARIALTGKAHLLCQHGYYAQAYGELLAVAGNTEAARNIAAQLDDDYLRLRALLGAARYKHTFESAVELLHKLPATDSNAGRAFRLASVGAEAARYLGRPAEFVDDLVKRFIEPEPPHARVGVMPFFGLVYSCLEAPTPVARRCFKRLREVYDRGDLGGVVGTVPLVLEGAERWLAGDVHGAAKAWRPMLRQGGNVGEAPFRHVFATALDRSEMPELAARVDARFLELAEVPDAIDLAFSRAATRAEKAGNFEQARKLAQACVDRWQHADDDVPARSEMQLLLKRVRSK